MARTKNYMIKYMIGMFFTRCFGLYNLGFRCNSSVVGEYEYE